MICFGLFVLQDVLVTINCRDSEEITPVASDYEAEDSFYSARQV